MNKFTTRLLAFLAGTLIACSANADVWHAAYGVAKTFDFTLYNADGTLDVDEADGGTEVTIDCNGTPATATNDFVDEGSFYSISVTAAELQCQRTTITVAATLTSVFFVETCGHASAFNISLCWETGDTFARVGAAGVSLTSVSIATGGIAATDFASGAIDATAIAADAIGASELAADAIGASELATDAIGAAEIAASAIGEPELGTGAITTAEFAAGAINAAAIAADAIGTSEASVLATAAALTAVDDFVDTEVATLMEALIVLGAEQTADSGSTTTAVDAALTQATDNWFLGTGIYFTSGTLLGQAACVTGFTAASDTLTFAPAVTTAVVAHTYYLRPGFECQTGDAFARVGAPAGASVSADVAAVKAETATIVADTNEVQISLAAGGLIESLVDDIGAAGAGLTAIDLPNQTMDITGTLTTVTTATNVTTVNGLAASVITAASIATDAIGATEVAVGAIAADAFAAGAIDAAAIAADAIGTSELATGAITTAEFAAGAIDAAAVAADAIGASELATDAIGAAEIAANALNAAEFDPDVTTELQAGLATPTNITAGTITTVTNLTNAPTAGDLTATMKTSAQTAAAAAINADTGDTFTAIPDLDTLLAAEALVNCTVNTAFFAGSSTTLACILTDVGGGGLTAATSDFTGLELKVTSGTQFYEGRFINATTWDGANSELRLTLSRALPATLADAVTAIIR